MTYKLVTSFPTASAFFGVPLPEINLFGFAPFDIWFFVMLIGTGLITALVGLFFGLPSLKIKGLYLAVTTLAAQFFLLWLFIKVPWFTNIIRPPASPLPHRKPCSGFL